MITRFINLAAAVTGRSPRARAWNVGPGTGSDVLDLEPDWLEGAGADLTGVAADDAAVDVVGDNRGPTRRRSP